jgi:phosphatidate cytidylyltransferase
MSGLEDGCVLPGVCAPPGLLRVMVAVSAFMGCCSAAAFLVPALRRPEARNVRMAIHSWWPPALTGAFLVLAPPLASTLGFACLSAWTLGEFLRLSEGRARGVMAAAMASVPVFYAAQWWGADGTPLRALLMWTFGVLPLVHLYTGGALGTLSRLASLQMGVMLCVGALGQLARLTLMPQALHGPASSGGFAALVLLGVMANDAAQYVAGKLLGRRALAPLVSPRKTWEGLLGGVLVTSLVSAWAAPLLTPWSAAQGALLGVGFSVLGLLGDLLVSAIKRDAGVKDTGSVLPGQGGVLDRCDSLLLVAPLYVHLVVPWLR